MKHVFLVAVLAIGLTLFSVVGTPAQTQTVSGEWAASMNTPGGARPFGLIFKVDGEKLTGTVKRASGDVPLEGTIKGNDISFSYSINYNGNLLSLFFGGKVDGDNMSGTVSFGGNADDSWSAKRVVKPKSD
jgi:hypothetical protein